MKKVFLTLIRSYQKYISPRKGATCRYIPTCSNYAIEAIERFGVFGGTIRAILRILRCNPFFSGGYDPVFEKMKKSRKSCFKLFSKWKDLFYG